MKLCVIYNFAQHYRTSIFRQIDQEYECDWYFGDSMDDVKKMDYSLLKGEVHEIHTKRLFAGWYYQSGVPSLIYKDYDAYLMLGETRAVSTWLFLLLSKFHPRKKVYFWSHGWYGKESRIEIALKKIEFNLPNGGVFLYGNYARELMIRNGFDSDKLFVIHNSLSYDEQLVLRDSLLPSNVYSDHFKNSNSNLIFIGRLTSVKKLDMVINAISILKSKGHNYNLTLIGGGEKEHELKQLVAELGVEEEVWFYGPCYEERVLGNLIYNADLCVSPGNVGLTAMHTMVFGTPVLTHNNFPYQMPEFEAVQDGETGSFFEYDNVDSLADNIVKWFNEKSGHREEVRKACFREIDTQWNPYFQIDVIHKNIQCPSSIS